MREIPFYGRGKYLLFLCLGMVSLWHDSGLAAAACFVIAAAQPLLQNMEARGS